MNENDATYPIRIKAGGYAGVDEGTACTQSSFKVNGKGFLYIGEQGGRHKAMFKLDESRPQAMQLAQDNPDCYEVGSIWITARFSDEQPMPQELWEIWLDESYTLSQKKSSKNA